MNFKNINYNHPIVYGIIAGIITYVISLLDVRLENKKLKLQKDISDDKCLCPDIKVSLKLPFIIGALVWACATYFKSLFNKQVEINNETSSIFDPDLSDLPQLEDIPEFN